MPRACFLFVVLAGLLGCNAGTTADSAESTQPSPKPGTLHSPTRPPADANATLKWLEQVRDLRLEYHCKVKYGSGRGLFEADPRQLQAKWKAIEAIVPAAIAAKVDPAVLRYFALRSGYELLVQKKEKDLQNAVAWWLVRHTLEDLGGDEVRGVFDKLPDDLEQKQDFQKIVDQVIGSSLEISKVARLVGHEDFLLHRVLPQIYPEQGPAMLAAIDVLHDPLAVGKFEKGWLEKNNPDLLRRLQVEGKRADLAAANEFARLNADRYLPDIERYGTGPWVSLFRQNAEWKKKFDEAGIGFLAVPYLRGMLYAFAPAVRESMLAKADTLDPATQTGLIADTLQAATLVLGQMNPRAPKRLGARLDDPEILPRLKKTLEPKVGFLGEAKLVEAPVRLCIAADGSRLVAICKYTVEQVDLKTGQPGEALVLDRKASPPLVAGVVTPKGDFAYVADQRRQLRRVDLAKGSFDDSFSPVTLTHDDPALALSPDGQLLAATGSNFVQLLNAKTGEVVKRINADNMVNCVRFTPDGKALLLGGHDRKANAYDVKTGNRLWKKEFGAPHGQYVYEMVQTADGYVVAGGTDHFTVWKVKEETPLLDVTMPGGQHSRCVGLTADRQVAINPYGLFDLKTKQPRINYAEGPTLHVLTPDARRLVYARGKSIFVVPIITGPEDQW